jgi:hypothetical protein
MRDPFESLQHLVEALPLDRSLRARDRGLDDDILIPGLARLEVGGVDAESLRDPGERLRRRARLAALDLADVLLREAVACEIRLGQAGGDAQLTQSGPETRRCTLLRCNRGKDAAFHRGM